MRILMLSQFYPPFIGGEAMQVQALSAELAARGHDVAVVTLWHQGLAPFEEEQGVRVYRVRSSSQRIPWLFSNRGRRRAPPFPDAEVMLALRHIIAQEHPEIVHAHNWLVHSFLPLKAWSGARLVMTLHNYNLVCVNTSLMYRGTHCQGPAFIKCLGCAANHYGLVKGTPIVLSHRMMSPIERSLVDMFLPVSQATALGNGLLSNRQPFQIIPNFMPGDASMPQGDCEPYLTQLPAQDYLLFVGALNRQKGIDVLLNAYTRIANAPPLVLIGYQTPDWPLLASMCPDNVYVLKDWPRAAVMQAWQRSLIALQPSVGPETFGMAAMEAMAAGCPVIASRIGGLGDLVADDETGFLVTPGDVLALSQAIERLLAQPDLRSRMGQAAIQKASEFQASIVVPRIECVYEELLHKTSPSRKIELRGDEVAI